MIINVVVTPNAKKTGIRKEKEALHVKIAAPAGGNRANKALIEALAGHFNTRKNKIRIISGGRTRKKVVFIGMIG
jgi:uncharacterized protein (TIGR00251 family)